MTPTSKVDRLELQRQDDRERSVRDEANRGE
jgi:hypothetical protein